MAKHADGASNDAFLGILAFAGVGVLVAGDGHEREIKPIHVILEVKHLGKTSAGELVFLPVAVGSLRNAIGDFGLQLAGHRKLVDHGAGGRRESGSGVDVSDLDPEVVRKFVEV